MKLHLTRFSSNNGTLEIGSLIKNIRLGKDDSGILSLHFETYDKYIQIYANGSMLGPDYGGIVIRFYPYLYTNGVEVEWPDDNFYDHPEYWSLELVLETNLSYDAIVTPLKHEYFISFIPSDLLMNYGCLNEVILIED